MHGVFFRVTFSRNPWLSLLDADEAWMASGEAELVKKHVFYKKHPKFSKVHTDSQEAFELWFCPLFLHYSTRVYRSFVKKSVSPLNAARNVKNDPHYHQFPRLSQGHKLEPRQQADLFGGRWRVFTITEYDMSGSVSYIVTCNDWPVYVSTEQSLGTINHLGALKDDIHIARTWSGTLDSFSSCNLTTDHDSWSRNWTALDSKRRARMYKTFIMHHVCPCFHSSQKDLCLLQLQECPTLLGGSTCSPRPATATFGVGQDEIVVGGRHRGEAGNFSDNSTPWWFGTAEKTRHLSFSKYGDGCKGNAYVFAIVVAGGAISPVGFIHSKKGVESPVIQDVASNP